MSVWKVSRFLLNTSLSSRRSPLLRLRTPSKRRMLPLLNSQWLHRSRTLFRKSLKLLLRRNKLLKKKNHLSLK